MGFRAHNASEAQLAQKFTKTNGTPFIQIPQQSSLEKETLVLTILLIILLLISVGSLPTWPYSRSWGYYPSSGLGLLLLIVLILLLIR